MVSGAVKETYTYYSPDAPRGVVIEMAPLAGRGKAWVQGSYQHPVYPSPLDVRVGDAGVHVWLVIKWLKAAADDTNRVLDRYDQVLATEDIAAASWYYEKYKDWIDQKLSEEDQSS